MATKSFTTEYKFTAKSAPNLINAIEYQENKKTRHYSAKSITTVKDNERINSILESYNNK